MEIPLRRLVGVELGKRVKVVSSAIKIINKKKRHQISEPEETNSRDGDHLKPHHHRRDDVFFRRGGGGGGVPPHQLPPPKWSDMRPVPQDDGPDRWWPSPTAPSPARSWTTFVPSTSPMSSAPDPSTSPLRSSTSTPATTLSVPLFSSLLDLFKIYLVV